MGCIKRRVNSEIYTSEIYVAHPKQKTQGTAAIYSRLFNSTPSNNGKDLFQLMTILQPALSVISFLRQFFSGLITGTGPNATRIPSKFRHVPKKKKNDMLPRCVSPLSHSTPERYRSQGPVFTMQG